MANGDETGTDCGGPTCDACPPGQGCENDDDCESGTCTDGICAVPSCDDGIQNGDETDVDCGASCGSTCQPTDTCGVFVDCEQLVCEDTNGQCADPSCTDGAPNGNETDVDCGGPDCDPCNEPGQCLMDSDCASSICDQGICVGPQCADMMMNGSETDVDCGGPDCAACDDGDDCLVDSDCVSLNCDANVCTPVACDDGIQNGDETDVDCGGATCDPCPNGDGCLMDSDCVSGACDEPSGVCEDPSCSDGVQNGDETDVDCGGGSCAPCNDGEMCLVGSDCASEQCDMGICEQPTCDDGAQNGLESDVDCGGPECPACDDFEMCVLTSDCMSMVCLNETCQPSSCTDGVQNGDETDVDCGGSCQPCDDGEMCEMDSDCTSMVCDEMAGVCLAPTCDDGVTNGMETDEDCGGPVCDACDDGEGCVIDSDCVSMVCDPIAMTCSPPACDDGIQNGDETDEDCGGACGATCEPGEMCLIDGDCLSANCDDQTMTCGDLLSVSIAPACSSSDGADVTLTATASGGTGGPYTFAWTPDDGSIANPTSAVTDVTPSGFSSFTVTVDDGVNQASDDAVVVDSSPFDLEDNCTLITADFGAGSGTEATITYESNGTVACENGNNEFGLHLCDEVAFSETRLIGQVGVSDDEGDNDWVGLVWGAQDDSNYYSLAWKQGQQNFFGCSTPAGVLVKRIEAAEFSDLSGADFYCPADTMQSTVLAAPANTTTAGWQEGETYTITIDYQAAQSAILIERDSDGQQIASFVINDDTFPTGAFGSTTLSQENACVGPLFAECL